MLVTGADYWMRWDMSAPRAGTALPRAERRKNAGRMLRSRPKIGGMRPRKRLRNGSVTMKIGCRSGWPCAWGNLRAEDTEDDDRRSPPARARARTKIRRRPNEERGGTRAELTRIGGCAR